MTEPSRDETYDSLVKYFVSQQREPFTMKDLVQQIRDVQPAADEMHIRTTVWRLAEYGAIKLLADRTWEAR